MANVRQPTLDHGLLNVNAQLTLILSITSSDFTLIRLIGMVERWLNLHQLIL